MSGKSKKFFEKVNQWAQNEAGYDDGYDDSIDEVKDYSGSASKSFNVFFMKNMDEYKMITDCLNRGSACAVNIEALTEEERKATIYRIEGILNAVRGSSVFLNKDNLVIMLLPKEFVTRSLE